MAPLLYIALVALPAAEGDVDLWWSFPGCPTREQMTESLEVLGLRLANGRGAASVQAVAENGDLVLTIAIGSHVVSRALTSAGSCQERAAVAATIIERALRPWLPHADQPAPEPPGPDPLGIGEIYTEAPWIEPAAPVPPRLGRDDPLAPPAAHAPDESAGEAPARTPLWMLSGSIVVLGGEGPTVRGGADAEVRYEVIDDLFAVFRLSYRTPRIEGVGTGEVRMDDGTAAIGVQIGAPTEALALQAAAMVQVAWAHGRGLDADYDVVRANPGIAVGVCYQKELGGWGLEACARGFGYLRRQEIHVNHQPVLGLPRVGGELALGVAFQL